MPDGSPSMRNSLIVAGCMRYLPKFNHFLKVANIQPTPCTVMNSRCLDIFLHDLTPDISHWADDSKLDVAAN
jgi:hypothetical protein